MLAHVVGQPAPALGDIAPVCDNDDGAVYRKRVRTDIVGVKRMEDLFGHCGPLGLVRVQAREDPLEEAFAKNYAEDLMLLPVYGVPYVMEEAAGYNDDVSGVLRHAQAI